jgi:hypothetical protein
VTVDAATGICKPKRRLSPTPSRMTSHTNIEYTAAFAKWQRLAIAPAYYRVSTARQGRSGLGLEAHVVRFAAAEGFEVAREFVEVETGKGAVALDRRPQLAASLAETRRRRCPVVVAKLDRLSRDVGPDGGARAVRRLCRCSKSRTA